MSIEEKIERIREHLRYHNDQRVTINLFGVYGTIVVEVSTSLTNTVVDFGMDLEKRLDFAIQRLGAR